MLSVGLKESSTSLIKSTPLVFPDKRVHGVHCHQQSHSGEAVFFYSSGEGTARLPCRNADESGSVLP